MIKVGLKLKTCDLVPGSDCGQKIRLPANSPVTNVKTLCSEIALPEEVDSFSLDIPISSKNSFKYPI